MRFASLCFFLLALFLKFPSKAEQPPLRDGQNKATQANWTAELVRPDPSQRIPGLSFPDSKIPVFLKTRDAQMRPLVEIIFFYDGPIEKLKVLGQKPKKRKNSQQYYVIAFLLSKVSNIEFTVSGADSKTIVASEKILLLAPEVQEYQILSSWASYFFSIGYGILTYRQSLFGTFVSQSAVLQVRMDSPNQDSLWGWKIEGLMTALTLQSEPVKASPQFLTVCAGGTMRVELQEQATWQHQAGIFLNSMALFANGSRFGFSPLLSTELGWTTRYYQDSRNSYAFDIRLAPLKNFSFDTQRTWTLAGSWRQTPPNSRMREWGVRYVHSSYLASNQQVSPSLFSLSLGWSF